MQDEHYTVTSLDKNMLRSKFQFLSSHTFPFTCFIKNKYKGCLSIRLYFQIIQFTERSLSLNFFKSQFIIYIIISFLNVRFKNRLTDFNKEFNCNKSNNLKNKNEETSSVKKKGLRDKIHRKMRGGRIAGCTESTNNDIYRTSC